MLITDKIEIKLEDNFKIRILCLQSLAYKHIIQLNEVLLVFDEGCKI